MGFAEITIHKIINVFLENFPVLSPPSKGIARGGGEGPVTPPLKAFSYHIGKTQSGG